ncbi:MAG: FecR domain-containing protein [Marinagarivorans sp.]|nr:FecR domain-containing protein [Marinagarivorans sp.]
MINKKCLSPKPSLFKILNVPLVCMVNAVALFLSASVHAGERCITPAATLESIEGQVQWRSAENTHWQNAVVGRVFCYGDQVKVVEYRAALRLENDTLVKLEEHSLLHLMAPEQGFWVELLQGAAHFLSRTPKAFSVKAPYLNAAVDGTEFIVRAATPANSVSVIEGQVTLSNSNASRVLTDNQQVSAAANKTLSATQTLTLKNSAAWVLYFPAIFSAANSPQSVQLALANSDYAQALKLLLQAEKRADQLALIASIYLLLGDINTAKTQLNAALQLEPSSPDANAVMAFMLLITQDRDAALIKIKTLVKQFPNNINVLLANSFILQSLGLQSEALQSAKLAFDLSSNINSHANSSSVTLANLPVVARYVEVLLNNQYYREAEPLIKAALQLAPQHSQLNTLAAFVALNQLKSDEASKYFRTAITTDSANALSHFGLAMAYIQMGEIKQGQQSLELAALLDPTNSIYRSYLGKTYFEEQKTEWASTQYTLAKKLDPNDPTPWLYDAHLLKQQGKLQETLVSLQTSKQLNDNRAVYRSRFLLDNDIAAKNANLTNVYLDLNIEQVAEAQAGLAATQTPTEFANHRAASLAYRQDNNAQVLQKNEATLTRLLQPIGAQALPVGVGQPAIIAYGWLSPSEIGTNEYSSLFAKRGINGSVNGYLGTQQSHGFDWQTQAVGEMISASIGQYNYGSEGFAENNDFDINFREANIHLQPIQALKLMAHLNTTKLATGDIAHAVDGESYDENFRKKQKIDEKTLGAQFQLSPTDVILALYGEANIETQISTQFSPFPGLVIDTLLNDNIEQKRQEVQWLKNIKFADLIVGHSNEKVFTVATPEYAAFDPENTLLETTVDSDFSNSYFRLNSAIGSRFEYLLGAGRVKWSNTISEREDTTTNYELGGIFNLSPSLSVAAATWRKTSEFLPTLGSLQSNFIYSIDTTDNNRAFNQRRTNAINLSWMPSYATFAYEFKKSKNGDDIATVNTLLEKRSIAEQAHELSGNFPIYNSASLSLNYAYKTLDTPIGYGIAANIPVAINDQKMLVSFNQAFGSYVRGVIEWVLFKQMLESVDEATVDDIEVGRIKSKNTAHQTNAKLNLQFPSNNFNMQLTAHNVFDQETPIDTNNIQRNAQNMMPTALTVALHRSVSLTVNFNF